MSAPGFLNVTFLSGLATGTTADVTITDAESLVACGYARLTTPGLPLTDPDPVFITAPAPDF